MAKNDWKDAVGTVSNIMVVGPQGRGGVFYSITFSYQVDGSYYSGEFTSETSEGYTEGGSLPLKYNPAKPEQNNLDGNGKSSVWMSWAITVVGSAWLLYLICFRGCRTH